MSDIIELIRHSMDKAASNLAYGLCLLRHTKMQPPCEDCRREATETVNAIHVGEAAALGIKADARKAAINKAVKRKAPRKRRRT